MTGSDNPAGLIAVIALLWGIGVTIFYMVCAWRAMQAHEKLAFELEELTIVMRKGQDKQN